MTNPLNKIRSAKRRLATLRLLETSPDYAVAEIDLQASLSLLGHSVAVLTIKQDIEFLKINELIFVKFIADNTILTITQNGVDCANGLLAVKDVARPSPQSLLAIKIIDDSFRESIKCEDD